MSVFSIFDQKTHKALGASLIERVFETKIYYVTRGRNAWHSTWVTHYFQGCMHDNIDSAKQQAESMRGPGSVFRIRHQPALSLWTAKGQVLITQINCEVPLSRWSERNRSQNSEYTLNHKYCRLEQHLLKPQCVNTVVDALGDPAVFSGPLPVFSKNIFVLATQDPNSPIEDRRRRLKQWNSSSMGGDFYLNWSEQAATESGKAIRRVADALNVCVNIALERQTTSRA
jgi:hypothetical protein